MVEERGVMRVCHCRRPHAITSRSHSDPLCLSESFRIRPALHERGLRLTTAFQYLSGIFWHLQPTDSPVTVSQPI